MGPSLHESLAAFDFYPLKLVQFIKAGEEVNLDDCSEKLSEQYTEEVGHQNKQPAGAPLSIIFLGLAVGAILIAMYLSMFQMNNSF